MHWTNHNVYPREKKRSKDTPETKWWAFQVQFISFSKGLPFSGVSLLGCKFSTGSLMQVWTGRKIYHHSIPSSLFRWLQDRFGKVIHEFWVFGNFLLSWFLFPKYIHNSNLTQGTCKCGYFRMSCNSYYIFRRYLHTIEASMHLLNLRQIPTWNQKRTSPKRMLG